MLFGLGIKLGTPPIFNFQFAIADFQFERLPFFISSADTQL
jgi:hypothetical protein